MPSACPIGLTRGRPPSSRPASPARCQTAVLALEPPEQRLSPEGELRAGGAGTGGAGADSGLTASEAERTEVPGACGQDSSRGTSPATVRE